MNGLKRKKENRHKRGNQKSKRLSIQGERKNKRDLFSWNTLWSAVTTFNFWGNWLDSFQLKVVDFVYLDSLYINILKIEQERYYKK
jgi:hypothetical protein